MVFQPPWLKETLKKKDLSVISAEVFELVLVFAVFFCAQDFLSSYNLFCFWIDIASMLVAYS